MYYESFLKESLQAVRKCPRAAANSQDVENAHIQDKHPIYAADQRQKPAISITGFSEYFP